MVDKVSSSSRGTWLKKIQHRDAEEEEDEDMYEYVDNDPARVPLLHSFPPPPPSSSPSLPSFICAYVVEEDTEEGENIYEYVDNDPVRVPLLPFPSLLPSLLYN